MTAELQKVQSEKYALTVRLEDFEQGFKDTIATKDREVAAMTMKLQEMTHQLHRANQELQQERERVLEAGMAKSAAVSAVVWLASAGVSGVRLFLVPACVFSLSLASV